LSPGDKVVQDANNKIASELDKTLKGSGTEADTPPMTDGRAIVEARNEAAKSRDPHVAHNQQYQDGSSNKTETVPVNDLTGGKLVNLFMMKIKERHWLRRIGLVSRHQAIPGILMVCRIREAIQRLRRFLSIIKMI
jgi:hypothetical protein